MPPPSTYIEHVQEKETWLIIQSTSNIIYQLKNHSDEEFLLDINFFCTSEILNTNIQHPFSTTQYPFSILYLPTQI